MPSLRFVLPAVVLGALVAAPAASADLPRQTSGTISLANASIGTVRLGVTRAFLIRAWGPPDRGGAVSLWDAGRGPGDEALAVVRRGRVTQIVIKRVGRATGPLSGFRTPQGFRLGSSLAPVRRLYPAGTYRRGGLSLRVRNTPRKVDVAVAGRYTLSFEATSTGRISSIFLTALA